eukprot:3761337-Rhodomonas_salina.2
MKGVLGVQGGHCVRGAQALVWDPQLGKGARTHTLQLPSGSRVRASVLWDSKTPSGLDLQGASTIIASLCQPINDLLLVCGDMRTLDAFKKMFLTRFDGTDEGAVDQYLGCEVIMDRKEHTVTLLQKVYTKRVLRLYGMWGCATVKTPLEPGTRLSKKDSPQHVGPVLHRWYLDIIGHISFLVSCTGPDLSFAYSELSKLVQFLGAAHLKAAERVLQYLMGTYEHGLTYRRLDECWRNSLEGWVDSDYATDPDMHWSVTGYVMT